MLTVYVVRHGPTDFNFDGRLRGWMNPPLNEEGFRLAKAVLIPDGLPVYTSDLLRAVQTAQALDKPFIVVPELRPWNVGIFAGQPAAVVHPRLVKYYDLQNVPVPFGESWLEFQKRLLSWVKKLQHSCVLVTHFRCCRLLLAWQAANYVDVDRVTMLCDESPVASTYALTLPAAGE